MANSVKTFSQLTRALADRGQEPDDLSPIGVRPRFGEYLRQLWERRHFIWYDSRQRAANQESRSLLGNGWLILRPMLDAAFYWLIFGVLIGADRGVENFPAFVVIGILMFRSTAGSLTSGTGSMRAGRSMIRAFSFPRAAIPISNVLQSGLTAAITTASMCVAIILIPPHALPQATWPLIIPIFLLHMAMNLGITFITARVGFHLPDMANIMSVFSRILMYTSGVIFPIERFIKDPTVREIITLNPLYRVIDMARTVLIAGEVPELESWLILLAWIAVLVVGGFLFFWRGEESYGRELR